MGSKNIHNILKNSDNNKTTNDLLGKKREMQSNLISTNINSNLNTYNVDHIEKLENVAMEKIKEKYDFEVEQISAQEIDEISVSSTKIRKALNNGDVLLANQFLGCPYFLTGKVVKGNQIGRTINFPTANIEISETYKLIPKNGVYIVSSKIEGESYYGMMNIGVNPTVAGLEQKIEVHFFVHLYL